MESMDNMGNVRTEFGSEELDKIFRYFMRTVLRMEKKGVTALPAKNDLPSEPLGSYLDLAVRMIMDAQPEETARLILESQYDFILSHSQLSADIAMKMWLIRELSLHIHYDRDPSEFLLGTGNLWGDLAGKFACQTFYPNMPVEWQISHGVRDIVEHLPLDFQQLNDY